MLFVFDVHWYKLMYICVHIGNIYMVYVNNRFLKIFFVKSFFGIGHLRNDVV